MSLTLLQGNYPEQLRTLPSNSHQPTHQRNPRPPTMNTIQISENRHVLLIQIMTVATQLITTNQNSKQFPILLETLRLTTARYHDLQTTKIHPQPQINTLESILDSILQHDRTHPNHGAGCACLDKHANSIRQLLQKKGFESPKNSKSKSNFLTILHYITRS